MGSRAIHEIGYHWAGMGWPNGPSADGDLYELASDLLLMCSPEARSRLDAAQGLGRTVIWRGVPLVGRRPAELQWDAAACVTEALNLTEEQQGPITDYQPWCELELSGEAGSGWGDFENLDQRYVMIGRLHAEAAPLLRAALPGARLHFSPFTPDHGAPQYVHLWREAADLYDVISIHAYGTTDQIRQQYEIYRALFPHKPIAISEWHSYWRDESGVVREVGDDRETLQYLADLSVSDPLFFGATYFIWRWDNGWTNAMAVEGNDTRRHLFRHPPTPRAWSEAPIYDLPAPREEAPISEEPPAPLPEARPDYPSMARAAAARHGVDPDIFERQIRQESGFNPEAVSSAGAQGIAQIIPRWHPGVDPFDPVEALDYAARLDRAHLDRFGDWPRALAAYNWGPTATARWDGDPKTLPGETKGYLVAILGKNWPALLSVPPVETPGSIEYRPEQAAERQVQSWTCSVRTAAWCLKAMGIRPDDDGLAGSLQDWMAERGLVSPANGLEDGRGYGLARTLREWMAPRPEAATVEVLEHLAWEWLHEHAGQGPVALGGHGWGESGHWVAVRGWNADRSILRLANPAPGYAGVYDELTEDQFNALGPFSGVYVRALWPTEGLPEAPGGFQGVENGELASEALQADKDRLVNALAYALDDLVPRAAASKTAAERKAVLAEAQRVRLEQLGEQPAA
ncbi:MAG: lytic transglycosylase domain-containing protein [Chloroflexota bacterium]